MTLDSQYIRKVSVLYEPSSDVSVDYKPKWMTCFIQYMRKVSVMYELSYVFVDY